ncbi:hypothetical protein [Streptomyces apocyni]|uniref:hypothetical protein n=1 Tax=Streptomyces apocyni TaxID=2654677 RepID=UPI0012EAEBB8|nr:hypothetical protein [Streptomyces apocyni]
MTLPEVRKGYRTAAQAGPRLANGGLGIVEFGKGVTWVGVYCRSEGRSPEKLSVVIDTIGEFTTVCPTGEVQHELHQLNLTEPFDGQVRIETADDVRWAANVQVSAPADS